MEHPAKIVDGITCLSTRATGLKCQSVVLREAKYLPRQLFRLDTRADGNGGANISFLLRSNFIHRRLAYNFPNYYIARHNIAYTYEGKSIFSPPPSSPYEEGGGAGEARRKSFERPLPTPCAASPQLMRANVVN